MASFEIVLIVLACCVPVVALMFVLPKIKRKEKQPASTKSYEELKKEENKQGEQAKQEKPKDEKQINPFKNQDLSTDEFKNFLKERQKGLTKPIRNELPKDFVDTTMPYMPTRRRLRKKEEPKTVAEEIRSLSPELKALIIAGVLDKKDFE